MEDIVARSSPEDVMDQLEAALLNLPAENEAFVAEVVRDGRPPNTRDMG